MTRSQFYDVLMNPDSYTGCNIVMYKDFPCCLYAQIFYCTPDKIYYTYNDDFGVDRYGTVTIDNYLLCQFVHLQKGENVL